MTLDPEILVLPIQELARRLDAGELSSEALVSAMLERIAAGNPRLNAFTAVFAADAIAQARALDDERRQGRSRGPLHGIPISVKDLIDLRGTPTSAASRVQEGHVAEADAPVMTRLREAGAVTIGKCNLHEFALGTTSDESAFGPARNPFDLDRSPGGSSGGSAAAVAACMSCASIGTDTGGSIRIPAASCGVVGLKPSHGEIPTAGVIPLSASLDHVGPLARTVGDAWLLHDAMKGVPHAAPAAISLKNLTLGMLGGYFLETLQDGVRKQFEEAIARLRDAGVSFVDARVDGAVDIPFVYSNIVLSEAYAFHARTLRDAPDKYSENVRKRLEAGRNVSADDYVRAQRARAVLRSNVDAALEGCDALVLPTVPIPAPRIGAVTVRLARSDQAIRPLTLRLTQLFNLTGHPAISLPCGFTRAGLPCGLQLVGRREATAGLLALALACEPAITRHPPRCAAGY